MRWAVALLAVAACGGDDAAEPDHSVEQPGMYAAATTSFTVADSARGRSLTMEAWYPTTAAPMATPLSMLEPDPAHATTYANMLAAAPAGCPTQSLDLAPEAPVADGSFPLILFSHCHSCTRLSNASTAARLATHGFVVVSVDHDSDTLWDHLDNNDGSLTPEVLELRAGDLRFALDTVVAGQGQWPWATASDLTKVGVFGHSFGAVTAGRVAQLDERVSAAAALCSPMENPLITGVTLAEIHQPLMFVVAVEDNSITEFGNSFIRMNYDNAAVPAWKIEIPDAGHWSVSDFAGLDSIFAPGCGTATRQTDGTPFAYRDPASGRALTAAYVTAFFKATLEDDAGARAYLSVATPPDLLVAHHE